MIIQCDFLKINTWVYGNYVNPNLLICIMTFSDNFLKMKNYYTYMGSAGSGDINDRK